MSWKIGETSVEISQGDLTLEDVDAIVNAANNDLQLGGGVAGAIARRGGPQIQEECDRHGPVSLGDAAITGGGRLKAGFVIHAASMALGQRTTAEALARSTARCLGLAADRGLRSIAFPAVGTGIARFPVEDCARIMLAAVAEHARGKTSLRLVRFVLYDETTRRVFEAEAGRQFGGR